MVHSKKQWNLNAAAFQRLLEWLDCGVSSNGETYLVIRQRLLSYFDRKNCALPDELVDETLNRVARRLEEEDGIETETPARYCYITARFVFMEYLRDTKRSEQAVEQMRRVHDFEPALHKEAAAEKELRQSCLDQCLEQLDETNRRMITGYYLGQERAKIENRRALAQSFGITMNALSIRACRVRDKLEKCARQCLGEI